MFALALQTVVYLQGNYSSVTNASSKDVILSQPQPRIRSCRIAQAFPLQGGDHARIVYTAQHRKRSRQPKRQQAEKNQVPSHSCLMQGMPVAGSKHFHQPSGPTRSALETPVSCPALAQDHGHVDPELSPGLAAGLGLKAVWYGAEKFGNVFAGLTGRKQENATAAPQDKGRCFGLYNVACVHLEYPNEVFTSESAFACRCPRVRCSLPSKRTIKPTTS